MATASCLQNDADSAFVDAVRTLSEQHGGLTSFVFEKTAVDQVVREASVNRFLGAFVVSTVPVTSVAESERDKFCRVYVGVSELGNEFSRRVVDKQEERKVRHLLGGLFLEPATYSIFVEGPREIRTLTAVFKRCWSLDEQHEHRSALQWNEGFPFSDWVYARADSRLTPVLFDVYFTIPERASILRVRTVDESSVFLYPVYNIQTNVRVQETHRGYVEALAHALKRRDKALRASSSFVRASKAAAAVNSRAAAAAAEAAAGPTLALVPRETCAAASSMSADEYVEYMEEQRLVETLERVLAAEESK